MRIENNVTIYAGDSSQQAESTAELREKNEKNSRNTVFFAGDLQGDFSLRDRIARKREQARKQALKAVGDVYDGDRAIDDDLNERRQHVRDLRQSSGEAQDNIDEIAEQREKLKSVYGITDDSAQVKELDKLEEYNQNIIDRNKREIETENAVVRGIRLERLKYHHMVDAKQQEEDIMKAAGEEIVGMVIEDAREHLDEEQEKREEEAEAVREEREEQEEFIEKQQEKRDEAEDFMEEIPVGELIDLSRIQTEVQREVENIVNKMNLIAEDIKGTMVDTNV